MSRAKGRHMQGETQAAGCSLEFRALQVKWCQVPPTRIMRYTSSCML
jgi:hypothetical protein